MFSRIRTTVISHTDTYISLMESPNEGSVAQLVVRQIPALKVRGSIPLWVKRFLQTKYSYETFVRANDVLVSLL